MRLTRNPRSDARSRGGSLLEDVERLIRRAVVVPLAAPLLLFIGAGLGKLTTHSLALPEGTPVRRGVHVPGIQLESLGRYMHALREDGRSTVDYVKLYHDHVQPVELSLRRRGVSGEVARRVAWPLVENSYRNGLDPATVLAVTLIESRGHPNATSSVGARGLMQVMPVHSGHWRGCGSNLYDIEDNLCNGTRILAWYLRTYNDERRALLGYNGCVNSSNTPNCWRYADKVRRQRVQILKEWGRVRPPVTGAAAP